MIRIQRAYEPPVSDGSRVILVDRLWPRGLRREDTAIDWWAKDVAPSTALRRSFCHEPEKLEEFRRRYHKELDENENAARELIDRVESNKTVTLLFAAKDELMNNAVVLREWLDR